MNKETSTETKEEGEGVRREISTPLRDSEHTMSARKAAVIVGGSSGIGRETALRLIAKGYRVYNISRTPFKGERVKTIAADAAVEGEVGLRRGSADEPVHPRDRPLKVDAGG